ncbi:hypothetical protein I3760_01G005600 [Carya illinoinensis]|uniref:Formin-like protein n=1 Tax=Carya illinoinensis TaxID=32201 RepID=A0A8T1RIC2_CARIL|nr:formin-like protein 6 [Carya illinoinensis]KAG2724183.1 hypothetical protein I3760_01G005600 [Carya illinoinensis]KAG6666083.1 hypothetical protein CIPAW_01G005700 [Carya illinoinensis]KAG6728993.1 hypothetical protein I3842_01G005100 [Carya illinoinensis]
MKATHHSLSFFFILLSFAVISDGFAATLNSTSTLVHTLTHRRILHQPLFPVGSAPPPESNPPPPPPPPAPPSDPSTEYPFFHEGGSPPDQIQPPPVSSSNGNTMPIPVATQPAKQTKTVAIAISVGIVTLGMLSALAFFLYRHRAKHPGDSSRKLVGGRSSERFTGENRVPPSEFLYIGTVEPSRSSITEASGANGVGANSNRSPYHKLNSIKRSDRYRPSPELQPLPPLPKPPEVNSPSARSSSDDESHDMAFHSPNCSSISYEETSYYTPSSRTLSYTPYNDNNGGSAQAIPIIPHSKRTSPKSRFSSSSPVKIQSLINQAQPPPPPPPPPQPPSLPLQTQVVETQEAIPYPPVRPKFSSPPPPPNMARLQSISIPSKQVSVTTVPPPPPPPPPPRPPISTPTPPQASRKSLSWTSSPKATSSSENGMTKTTATQRISESERSSCERQLDWDDEKEGIKPKLKPLHWDKVRATSERATVWDQLKSSSFQLNEDMMESLFGCKSANSVPKQPTRKSVLPPVERENRVLDPKKSQNIAILLRALNVTRDEVSEALLDGNPEGLGAELLETLVKMAPTKEEEIKLRDYRGDISKLGSAERFLKAVLDIPFAFKRVEAMLYRANFDTEVTYLRKSFQTLEAASEELKNSRLFFKLLEAVLRTGNRMNVGTNRGDAKAFKLDTLLKLADIKGTDGKTTLLHFVVQEIIRSEGTGSDSTNENVQNKVHLKIEDNFKKQGLQVVAGLSRDLGNVKKAAGMDSDVLSSYVSKLEMGLDKVRLVLQCEKPDMQGRFFNSMKLFLKEAEEEIARIKADEKRALYIVKEVTEYFHGNAAKEEAHPFRIFMIVRDFLGILDQVCKEVGMMQDRTMLGSARSFRISATASLPVLNRYNVNHDRSSDEESSSP